MRTNITPHPSPAGARSQFVQSRVRRITEAAEPDGVLRDARIGGRRRERDPQQRKRVLRQDRPVIP
jgi:hypothetical protein